MSRKCDVCSSAPASLYPAGWRCREHTPARLAGKPEPPSTPFVPERLTAGPAAPCRYCGGTAYGRDATGQPAHECCHAWRAVIAEGNPCPACAANRWQSNPRTRGKPMPPLPRKLRDGRPYVPWLPDD
jgi:hypothetical protein